MPGALKLGFAKGRLKNLLPDTAAILRETLVDDGAGGRTAVEATVATVRCMIDTLPVSARLGQEMTQGGRLTAVTVYQAFLPAGTDCTAKDRLQALDRNGAAKGTFEVIDTDLLRSNAAVLAVNVRLVE
jgi:hypothetical protein